MFACSDRGGNHRRGASYFNLCSTDDEGFGLDGLRGGWIFALANLDRLIAGGDDEPTDALAEDGVAPAARFMASLRGRDPNHDTAGMMFPRDDQPGTAYVGVDRDCSSVTTIGITSPGSSDTPIRRTTSSSTAGS